MPKSAKISIKPKSAVNIPPSYADIRKTATDGIKQHGKAAATTENYFGHIRRGRQFLENFVLEESRAEGEWCGNDNAAQNLSTEGEESIQSLNSTEFCMPAQFREAFDSFPIECTPLAISMFIAFKCYTHNRGKSTASAIHAAFLRHYDQMSGDKYRGKWHFDVHSKEWVGNPVRSAEVEDQVAACKQKDGEGERKHSRAISIQDMQYLLRNFKHKCPSIDSSRKLLNQRKEITARCNHLLFNALSTSAFTIWMRVGEATSLQYKHFEFPMGRQRTSNGHHFFRLNLRNRKNWQKREKNGEHQLSGHTYMIYQQPKTPEIDMYTHLLDWLEFYEAILLGRPLQPDDFIFPIIGTNGISVQPSRAMTAEIAQKKINQMASESGIHGAAFFTTHCFRRGGAQYRFMFAPLGERWTLARIRWWGGWATGEHRDTLIRYLLDELYTYEEDHSNALCPKNVADDLNVDHKLVLNAAPPAEIVAGFTRQVAQQIDTIHSRLKELQEQHTTEITVPHSVQGFSGSSNCTSVDLESEMPTPAVFTSPHHLTGLIRFDDSKKGVDSRRHLIPGLPRKLLARAFEQVAKDWEEADPVRSLYVPMKLWDPQWHKDSGESQKYGQRQTVALEFIDHYKRDKSAFMLAYPEHSKGFTPLLKAIRKAQQIRGECEQRRRKIII
ncbi:hypothetical protein JR316_0011232 [Psilocybe cubensis]|uniref:Tyr recombinase domain-containing protein n=2 Tax=Psilocybe cubensis TaxID=181762 RepID=A0A8H7XWB8_PSICU|nr:hypothetical protein JR316_0011232 [Psilocybe cubensis]KAH9475673.1 hypothetical protein JR316_0011232 [Psilocybe cubensis]